MSVEQDWFELGSTDGHRVFYKKHNFYDLPWNVDLLTHNCRVGENGGPFAIFRDATKVVRLDDEDTRSNMRIYSPCGDLMAKFSCGSGDRSIIEVGWTEDERLVCVLSDGCVQAYDISGNVVNEFTMGEVCGREGVATAVVWSRGVVCVSASSFQMFAVDSILQPRVFSLSRTPFPCLPKAIAVVSPEHSDAALLTAFVVCTSALPTGDVGSTVYVCTEVDTVSKALGTESLSSMSVSPNGRFVAVFSVTGTLYAYPASEMVTPILTFPTKSIIAPHQLVWCGNDAIALYWDPQQMNKNVSLVLLIDDQGNMHKFQFDGAVRLVQEMDSFRIISQDKNEIVQRVPRSTIDIYEIGSTLPAASLMDAYEMFVDDNPSAVESMNFIRDDLGDAVEACITSARHEFDPVRQKKLLRAASYGKSFCEVFDKQMLPETCRYLRVLNAVRDAGIGLPITYDQLQGLTVDGVIDKLLRRRMHFLATRIVDYLGLPVERVLLDWACFKVRTKLDDATIVGQIHSKLRERPSISYASVAEKAFKEGRRKLAVQLLEFEPRADEQVPLLLAMQANETALQKAIDSNDTELVYHVILELRRRLSEQEFFDIVVDKPAARALTIAYYKETDMAFVQSLYAALGMHNEAAAGAIYDAYSRTSINPATGRVSKEEVLQMRLRFLQFARDQLQSKKENAMYLKTLEEQLRLFAFQAQAEKETGVDLFGASVSDTLFELVRTGHAKTAKKLKEEQKIPDKRYYWVKIRGLGSRRDWEGLFAFSKERKSPIGYRPFVEVCKMFNAIDEALRYCDRITDPAEKVECYADLGNAKLAADTALSARDPDLFQRLLHGPFVWKGPERALIEATAAKLNRS